MRKSRFSEAQIVAIVREFDAGASRLRACTPARHSCQHHPALAVEVRRHGRQRSRPAQAARGRERANAAHHRSPNAQGRCHGRADPKKLMEPSQRQKR